MDVENGRKSGPVRLICRQRRPESLQLPVSRVSRSLKLWRRESIRARAEGKERP